MSFDLQLIVESLPVMLMGIGITFKLLVISGVLGPSRVTFCHSWGSLGRS